MKTLYTLGFLISSFLFISAQSQKLNLYGRISDSVSDSAIYNANIRINDSNVGTSSDKNGKFSLAINAFPLKICISHISYEEQSFILYEHPGEGLDIHLNPSFKLIREVIISSEKVKNLTKDNLFAVNDFEIFGQHLLMLVYDYNFSKEKNPWLVLINSNGDTICKTFTGKDGSFFKDCTGQIHLLTQNEAWQIFISNNSITLAHPSEISAFTKAMEPCIASIGSNYFLKKYSHGQQVLNYIIASTVDSSYENMRIIADNAGLKMLVSRNRFFAMGANPPTDADLRFEEMCFTGPVFAPLYKLGKNILIFNFVDSKLEFYSEQGIHQKDIPINFHKNPCWKEEIISDERCEKVYSLFIRDGISTLREINLENGKLMQAIKIPKFKFIEKLKVNDNKLFFLYRKTSSEELKAIYVMSLE